MPTNILFVRVNRRIVHYSLTTFR